MRKGGIEFVKRGEGYQMLSGKVASLEEYKKIVTFRGGG